MSGEKLSRVSRNWSKMEGKSACGTTDTWMRMIDSTENDNWHRVFSTGVTLSSFLVGLAVSWEISQRFLFPTCHHVWKAVRRRRHVCGRHLYCWLLREIISLKIPLAISLNFPWRKSCCSLVSFEVFLFPLFRTLFMSVVVRIIKRELPTVCAQTYTRHCGTHTHQRSFV